MKKPYKISYWFLMIMLSLNIACDKYNNNGNYESYRYKLWKLLIENEYNINFLGSYSDIGCYKDYKGQTFDRDHEGIPGIQTEGVLNNIGIVLNNIDSLDVVLLGIGVNDIIGAGDQIQEPILNVKSIIDTLQSYFLNVTILIEQVPSARNDYLTNEMESGIQAFNALIVDVANEKNNLNSKVIAVDMYTQFENSFYADFVHYNGKGAKFVASKYFEALETIHNNSSKLNILLLGDSRVAGNRKN